ncbi:hypothetical protein PG996_013795 [Apiospora saccharicola]|uniref:Uncharacterized protein n=1 Tax=Apiospora saccharicola TaxID=335842 RepID=A0ABR1TGG8_9PEZI
MTSIPLVLLWFYGLPKACRNPMLHHMSVTKLIACKPSVRHRSSQAMRIRNSSTQMHTGNLREAEAGSFLRTTVEEEALLVPDARIPFPLPELVFFSWIYNIGPSQCHSYYLPIALLACAGLEPKSIINFLVRLPPPAVLDRDSGPG